jgi:hypothetical protein
MLKHLMIPSLLFFNPPPSSMTILLIPENHLKTINLFIMKKQILPFVALLGLIFSLSACFNEEESLVQPEKESSELLVPQDELSAEETEIKRTGIKPFDPTTPPMIRQLPEDGSAEKRGHLTRYDHLPFHKYKKRMIYCGDYLFSHTEYGEKSLDNHNFYRYWGLHTELNGRDQVYYFTLKETSVVEFKLSDAHANLAMMLFKGSWEYDQHHHKAKETYEKLVAFSTSHSQEKEYLGPLQLEAGTYILVIDSRYGQDSEYRLDICCKPVFDGCYNYGVQLRHEDFESYQEGYIADQSPYWEKWNHHNPYNDARVYHIDHKFGKVLKVCRDPYKNSRNQDDVIYNLGESQDGIYELSFDMGVYKHRSGYFDIQKCLTRYNQYNEIGAKVYFKSDGRAYVLVNGKKHWFHYKNGYWFKVKLTFDFLDRKTKLFINGDFICSWKTTHTWDGQYGSNKMEGLSFRPAYTNSCFVVDNICYSVVALI